MDGSLCARCGIDAKAIAERLRLVGLENPESTAQGKDLQERVIGPNVDAIIGKFHTSLSRLEQFNKLVGQGADLGQLRDTQKRYLLSLGVDIQHRHYFEDRLRIGAVHQRVGVPQSLYQCTVQGLQSLLIEYIPAEIRRDESEFEEMIRFILKITALDMSLAVESYCAARVAGLQKTLTSERGETERLRQVSVTDSLTGLYNHSYSRHCLAQALERARTERLPLCVIMADLDHFKGINDTYGHLVGDQVLRVAAGRMLSAARTNDEICRYGGEEFLFILQNTDIAGGEGVAERVRTHIHGDAMRCGDKEIHVSLSLGVAEACDGDTVNALIAKADAALYAAKRAGRNCVRSADTSPHRRTGSTIF